jgi:RNA:NAD 2'-phosphotransferase (TPT1/KptA family)
MSIEGFIEYKRREFCNDVKCPVQIELNKQKEKSDEYERIRKTCSTACRYTTWQFHHWLMEKGYIIIASLKLKNKSGLISSIDKDILEWIDEQVKSRKYSSRSQLIENAIAQYKKQIE